MSGDGGTAQGSTTRGHTVIAGSVDRDTSHVAVAALALGLSYAGLTTDDYAAELARGYDLGLLHRARNHLDAAPYLPAGAGQAQDLLERAIEHTSASMSKVTT